MSTSAQRVTKPPHRETPPLRNGDPMTVAEFERRYEAMPHVKKAELIDGIVYVPSPVSMDEHAEPHCDIVGWLWVYRVHTPGVQAGDNATLRLPAGMHQPQPDGCLRILPAYGGRSRTSSDGYVVGAAEFIGEIAASTVSYDLHQKLDAYQLNGVKEYLVWRVLDRAIDWFVRRGGTFRPMRARDGVFRSKAFPGLWLDANAAVAGDMATVFRVLQAGLATEEHRRFVEKLAKRGGKQP